MLQTLNLQSDIHRRYNPLTNEWVLVSPHRNMRPWQGQLESENVENRLAYDPNCYLCPGNVRAAGLCNPQYESTFVFDNDFPALLSHQTQAVLNDSPLLRAQSESGRCRVICYSPLHNMTMGQMPATMIKLVIDAWVEQDKAFRADPRINAVIIFENRGAMMGASNPHPHGQMWATETVPDAVLKESVAQMRHFEVRSSCLLCDYVSIEIDRGERLVCTNEHFIAVVPFWAAWPFETLVLPRAHVSAINQLNIAARDALAQILKDLITRYDALFDVTFPYTMGLHQQPTDNPNHLPWHLHAHFYPPLLRSASVRKFMVGFELLAGAQRDLTPEAAAGRLRGD
jgi:UDPglucose--hexose-1-phosphate uridylyltransferase